MSALWQWILVVVAIALVYTGFRLTRPESRFRVFVGYALAAALIVLGLPLFLGYVPAIFPLVGGLWLARRTRRAARES